MYDNSMIEILCKTDHKLMIFTSEKGGGFMLKKFVIPAVVLSMFFTLAACTTQGRGPNNGISINDPEQTTAGHDEPADPAVPAESTDPAVPAVSTGNDAASDNDQDASQDDSNIVEITGSYTRFDEIKGFGGDYQYLSMIGEADGHIIMEYLPYTYSEMDKPSLMLVDLDTLEVKKTIVMESPDPDSQESPISHIKMAGDKILVCFDEYISVMDKALEPIEEIPLPEAIIERSKREEVFDDDGISSTYYGGYDISNDMEKIVFTDEAGIKLYDMKSNKEVLLTKNIYNENLLSRYYYVLPRFIANDKKVIVDKGGYEYSLGYTIYGISDGGLKTLNLFTEFGPNEIYYDTGLLEPGISVYNAEKGEHEGKRIYLDFESGDVTELQVEKYAYEHYFFQDNVYVGENYAAYATYVWYDDNDENETKNDMYYINRLNLKTLETENDILEIKGGGPHILGVLADGRVLFCYNYRESESGVCIAK